VAVNDKQEQYMNESGKIREAIGILAGNGEELYAKVCAVLAVHEDTKSIDVQPVDGTAEIMNVPLQADTQSNGLVIFPKKGSRVLVVFTSKHTAVMCNTGEIDGIEYKDTQGVEWRIRDGKITVKNSRYSLKQAFDELMDAIGKLTVTTGVGPSGVPINKTEFEAIKQKINNLFT
jgi:hypothetical protein